MILLEQSGGICGVMGDRYVNSNNMAEHDQRSIWYIDANDLYGYAMMQKLPFASYASLHMAMQ